MENSPRKEIDILELLARFYRALKKNLIYTILFPLLGLAAGLILYAISKEKVSSEMLVATDLMNVAESTFWMEQLEKSDTLPGLSVAQGKISRLRYEIIPSGDPNNHKTFIKISARVSDNQFLGELEKSIVSFINQLDVVVNHRKQQEIYHREMISQIDAELEAMNQLKQGMTNASKAGLMNPADLFVKSVELKELKLKHQMLLDEQKSVEIIKHFSEVTKTYRLPYTVFGLAGLLAGTIVLLVFLAISGFLNYYQRFEKSFEA